MPGLWIEDIAKKYGSVVNVRPLDRRYCEICEAIVNERPLEIRYCKI